VNKEPFQVATTCGEGYVPTRMCQSRMTTTEIWRLALRNGTKCILKQRKYHSFTLWFSTQQQILIIITIIMIMAFTVC